MNIYTECLQRNHCLLLDTIDPKEGLLDQLFQEGYLTECQMETILAHPARRERSRAFIFLIRRLSSVDGGSVLSQVISFFRENAMVNLALAMEKTLVEMEMSQSAFIESGQTSNARPRVSHVVDDEGNRINSGNNIQKRCEDTNMSCSKCSSLKQESSGAASTNATTHIRSEKSPKISDGICRVLLQESTRRLTQLLPHKGEDQLDAPIHDCSTPTILETRTNRPASGPLPLRDDLSDLSLKSTLVETEKQTKSVAHREHTEMREFDKLYPSPLVMPPSNFGMKSKSGYHCHLFDRLSAKINSGDFDGFDREVSKMPGKNLRDPDIACTITYLDACKSIIQSNFKKCKSLFRRALEISDSTSSPSRFKVEIMSVGCWMYLKKQSLSKVRPLLDDSLNIIAQDPVTCSGRAAGWIHVDVAKCMMPLLSCDRSFELRRVVVSSLEKAMHHFRLDDSKDGPYGFSFAAVKLISIQLACDDQLRLVDCLEPTKDDLRKAADLLTVVDNSQTGIAEILKPLYFIALADYKYRTGNIVRAFDLVKDAHHFAERLNLIEEAGFAEVRCKKYGALVGATENPLIGTFHDATLYNHEISILSPSKAGISNEATTEFPKSHTDPCPNDLKRKHTGHSHASPTYTIWDFQQQAPHWVLVWCVTLWNIISVYSDSCY